MNYFKNIAVIFIGGAIGGVLRYGISEKFLNMGTFLVNIVGCFVIGFVAYVALKRKVYVGHKRALFFNTGLAGGLTTFGSFLHQALFLFMENRVFLGVFYVFISLFVGLLCVYFGQCMAKNILIYRAKMVKSGG